MFQGLAADGAKLALWKLWRAGYGPVALVHDQVLIAVPANSDLPAVAADINTKMIEGMEAVVPDVRVGIEGGFKTRWTKKDTLVLTPLAQVGGTSGECGKVAVADAAWPHPLATAM
jgi:hypothetical protein